MEHLYQKFCNEAFDENGVLTEFSLHYPESYNFAYDVVDFIAAKEPDRRAMVWCNVAGEEATFTFGDMKRYSDKAAAMLQRHGVKKGDRVLLILKRHYQFWFAVLACHKLGAIAIPATHMLTKKDLIYRMLSAGVTAVICTSDGSTADDLLAAEQSYHGLTLKMIVRGKKEGFLSFDEELEASPETFVRPETKATDPMLLYFTSGTTGYPKMVMHDHTYSLAHIPTARHWQNVDPNGLHLTVSDTGWGKAAWGKLYGQWLCAAAIMVYDYDRFIAHDLLEVMAKYRVTTFCAPPTIFRFFVKEGIEKYDLSHIKYVTTAGEALNREVYDLFLKYTGKKIMEGFGQTETTLIIGNPVHSQNKPGSLGKPMPLYPIELIDADCKPVKQGETGEIAIRLSEQKQHGMFIGYYKDEELRREVCRGGYYHTGDTAYADEDGYLWYVGRTDDIIKSSGYRIGPFEIESVLMEHPAVLECAITGVPDEIRGQVIKATIHLTSSYQPSEELKKELQEFVKKATAPYKYPRVIEFVDELPKTISGKIRRVEIRERDQEK